MTGLADASPRDVVPGDPAAAEELAAALGTYAGGAAENAAQLRGAGDGPWVGEAADAFRGKLSELPDKLERGIDAFVSASQALGVYADALRDGQAKAAHAIELAGQAEREHAAWQRQVEAYNQAVRAGTVPDFRPAETSPGAATMAEAEALVNKARAPVEDAAAKAAAVLRDGADQAPDTSSLPGDLIRGVWGHYTQVWAGAAEATYGLGEFVFTHSNVYALIDPEGYVENMTSLAQGLIWGAQHPVEFGKAVIDWETWKTNPSRAVGHLLPDAVLTAATAGAGGAGAAASRGASAASRLSRAADDVEDLADIGEDVEDVADVAEDVEDVGDAADAARPADGLDSDSEIPPPRTAADGPPFPAPPKFRDPDFDGETEGLSPVLPPGHRVKYLDEDGREERRLFVHDGRLYGVDGRPFDTSTGMSIHGGNDPRAIFVMDEYGNIYASNYHALGEFHHSSLLAGEPVSGAGEMRVVNGRLEFISDQSGHYKPPPEYLEQVIERLREDGIDFDDVEFGTWS